MHANVTSVVSYFHVLQSNVSC